MLKCLTAWRKLAPLTRASSTVCGQNGRIITGLNNGRRAALAPAAHMSTAGAGGGVGAGLENKIYFSLVGLAFLCGGIYVYKTIKGDAQRYDERVSEIMSRQSKGATDKRALWSVSSPGRV